MRTRAALDHGVATLVAAAAWFGLAVQFAATLPNAGSVGAALWILVRYFTILVNAAVALAFSVEALRRRTTPAALTGGITLNILLVAIVYHLLLHGLVAQTAIEQLADLFLHSVTPALVVLHWALCTRRGGLRWRDPLAWAVLPLLYLAYALVRGGEDSVYPYPFLDVARFGAARVTGNAAAIAIAYVLAGFALVWFDRRLGAR